MSPAHSIKLMILIYPPNTCNLIVTNCQSVKSKKDSFTHLLSITNPDFFIGTESWLTEDINNNEIFASDYTVHRKDCTDGYGGVYFGCRNI